MLNIFVPIKSILKLDEICIDNTVFRFHYKLTVIMLITASLLVTSRQYIGDPIDCMHSGSRDISQVIDTYCWIQTTYSIPTRWSGKIGSQSPYPGVAPRADLQGVEEKYHKYYQWVCFVLFLQAMSFYVPRYIWKSVEGGKIRLLVQKLQEPLLDPEEKEKQIGSLVDYWKIYRGTHTVYAFKFFLCEILNLANTLLQIWFTDFFLDNEFRTYGLQVITLTQLEPEDRPDPITKVFPKVTKCTFYTYGVSGTIQISDALCVLPLNIINEKIYVMLWFWFIFLFVVTFFSICFRLVIIMSPAIQLHMILWKGGRSLDRKQVKTILNPAGYNCLEKLGDWFVLHTVLKNLNALTVNDILKRMHKDQLVESNGNANVSVNGNGSVNGNNVVVTQESGGSKIRTEV